MNVLLINGSPHAEGCTYTALCEIANQLKTHGIDSTIFQIGNAPIRGCQACNGCYRNGGACVFTDDCVVECMKLMRAADGVIVGSPVYYSGPNGQVTSLLDRIFYGSSSYMANKPASVIVSCRRGGASDSYDRLLKYFQKTNMPIVTSTYWNSVHGNTPDEVRQDKEGLQVMRMLANNMAWLLKMIEATRGTVPLPVPEPAIQTNFIR